jgi:iron complex outermembrane receptor protein
MCRSGASSWPARGVGPDWWKTQLLSIMSPNLNDCQAVAGSLFTNQGEGQVRSRITCLIPVVAALVLVPAARAQLQTSDTLEYIYPMDILVTAPRMDALLKEIPFPVSIIDRATMDDLPRSISFDEYTKLVPGVKVDNQSNGMRVHVSMRGQGILTERGIRGIRILYDGIPVNDPTGFAPDLFDVDPGTVDRIEVLRGPAASLYGGSASGGIVNIFSQNSPLTRLFGEAGTTAGSNRFWKAFGQFGGNVDPVNYRLSFSRTAGDGYREHTHFWGDNVYGKATYTPTGSVSLTPILGWTNTYHENPEGITLEQYRGNPRQANPDAIPYNEYLQTNRWTVGLNGVILLSPKHELQFAAYFKRTLFTEANNGTFNDRTIEAPGASVQYTLSWGSLDDPIRNSLSIGTDFQWQTIDERRVDNLHSMRGDTIRSTEHIRQHAKGAFAITKVNIGGAWDIMLSLRYDAIRNQLDDLVRNPYDLSGNADFQKLTGRVGMTYSPWRELNLFANVGQGFLPPATEELAQNPDNFGGFNKHLTFATSLGFDLGMRGTWKDQLYYDVTGFLLKTENDFDRYRISDPLRIQETFYRNAGSSRRFGLEAYARWTPLGPLHIQLAYTYSHFTYTNTDSIRVLMDDPADLKYVVNGNSLPNSPRHQLCVDVQYALPIGLSVALGTETLSRAYIDGANVESEAVVGYTLLNMRLTYGWHLAGLHGEISLQGRNLGDVTYVAFSEPDPGGNAYQPGPGREFFAGVKIQL